MTASASPNEQSVKTFYLAGAIEHAPDGGLGWRAKVTAFIEQYPDWRTYNPATDEKKPLTAEELAGFRAWRIDQFDRFRTAVRKIIRWDLERLEQSDAVICFWDEACRLGGGTPGELTVSFARGIPVFLVTFLPLDTVSSWVLGCCAQVFDSFEALEAFLAESRAHPPEGPVFPRFEFRSVVKEVPMQKSFRGQVGWVEVVCGSMFSGKSEELIRRLKRAEIARLRIQVFKPAIDNRFSEEHIVSHSEMRFRADIVSTSKEIMEKLLPRTEVIGIDEAQFFDAGIVDVCNILADMGKRVIVAGLDKDYLGRPFEPMPQIMAIAEDVAKAAAICMQCGAPAYYTQRLIDSTERIVVGAAGAYEARCRRCFEPPANPA